MAATARFFGSYELLQTALLRLPLRSLLLAQGINKACFDVIQGSSDIRRALFMIASAATVYAADAVDADEFDHHEWRRSEGSKAIAPVLNPFIRTVTPSIDVNYPTAHPTGLQVRPAEHHAQLLGAERLVLTASSLRTIETLICWRDASESRRTTDTRDAMLLSHPPVGNLLLSDWPRSRSFYVRDNGGITYGTLRDAACCHWADCNACQQEDGCEDEDCPQKLLKAVQEGRLQPREVPPAVYDLLQTKRWKRVSGDVDVLIGYEMLAILSTVEEDRRPLDFLKPNDDNESSDNECDDNESSDSSITADGDSDDRDTATSDHEDQTLELS